MARLQISGLLVAPSIAWCWDAIRLKERPCNLLMRRSYIDLFSSTVGPLAWLGYCFHIQAEHNFVILMSKQHTCHVAVLYGAMQCSNG